MKWLQAGSYLVQPTQQNIPVIEIFTDLDAPAEVALVYNPKQEHALLFRNDKVGIILDYLDSKAIKLLDKATEAAVCEMDEKTQRVRYYYRVPIQRVKEKLNIQLMTRKAA